MEISKEILITSTPGVMIGKPCFTGTRIPVDLILQKLGEGATEEYILSGYPSLTREHLQAALRYAADYIRHDRLAQAS